MKNILGITSVHDALIHASDDSKKPNLIAYTFKVDPEEKDIVEKICQKNGTTISKFLRYCMKGLISDYKGE